MNNNQYNQLQPKTLEELLAKYDETGELDPIFMANLTQEIFENPITEKLDMLDKIVEYVKAKTDFSNINLQKDSGMNDPSNNISDISI